MGTDVRHRCRLAELLPRLSLTNAMGETLRFLGFAAWLDSYSLSKPVPGY